MKGVESALEWINTYIWNFGENEDRLGVNESFAIKKALEKEIPKLPNIHTENEYTDADGNRGMKVTYVECPNCGTEIDELNGLPRCMECGQVIKWGNED